MGKAYLAIDVGGTFIDFVYFDPQSQALTVEKIPSSGSLEKRFFEGIDLLELDLAGIGMIVHGSTQVLNTILQENGAKVGLVTTKGFRDVLELGRGSRPEVYNLLYKPAPPLVPRYLRYEVSERLDFKGKVLQPLCEAEVREAVLALKEAGVEGIAICFLHAYANPAHEEQAAAIARTLCPDLKVCTSAEIVREFREFERTSTTVLNAYTQPRMSSYLHRLEQGLQARDYLGSFAVMQSSGGITSSRVAQQAPIRTVQSGPAGGVIGTAQLGKLLGLENLVAADVGGTTFDVALITGGKLLERSQASFNKRPVLQTTIDIVSVGAGGGSIAHMDAEGGLKVGPQSAQADPGPACYGLGGQEATVTDAQLVLGYLDPQRYLGERMKLSVETARQVIVNKVGRPLGLALEEAAAGILHLANMNMSQAIRQVTIERGYDPRDFSLVSYGGGGGLFAAALLEELELKRVLIPQHPAAFSAWGLLNADYREDISRTLVKALNQTTSAELAKMFKDLEADAEAWFEAQGLVNQTLLFERFAELRYFGQEHTLKVPVEPSDLTTDLNALRERFDHYYDQAYAHALSDHDLEFVGLRLSASLESPKPVAAKQEKTGKALDNARIGTQAVFIASHKKRFDCPVYDRLRLEPGHTLQGPAIVEEWNSTVLVFPGQVLRVDDYGNLIMDLDHG